MRHSKPSSRGNILKRRNRRWSARGSGGVLRPARSRILAVLRPARRAQKHKHRERQKRNDPFAVGAWSQCATTLARASTRCPFLLAL